MTGVILILIVVLVFYLNCRNKGYKGIVPSLLWLVGIGAVLFIAWNILIAVIFGQIRDSHIEGNVPEQSEFENYLIRDLNRYFSSLKGQDVEVVYELLRAGPTQSGVSFPKYYAWVEVQYDGIREEGAVRIAAIGGEKFEVTHYIEKSEIETTNIEMIFSAPLIETIRDFAAK